MGNSAGGRAVIAALLANLGIAASKLVAFAITGSASLAAEAVHSLVDSTNQGLLLRGGRRSRREPDERHAFGHGRERYFYAFVVALVLFIFGSMFAIFEGIEKIRFPHHLVSPGVAIGVLLVAIVLESLSFRTAIREANLSRGVAQGWSSFIRHAKAPELPVVLLEDAAALVGLVLALAAVVLAITTGNPRWDGVGTLAIGLLLGSVAVILVIETKSLLIGESATPADVARIEQALASGPGITRVIHLRTQHIGPDELLVGAKVELDRTFALAEIAAAIDAAEALVRTAVPNVTVMYLEPDLYRPPAPTAPATAPPTGD